MKIAGASGTHRRPTWQTVHVVHYLSWDALKLIVCTKQNASRVGKEKLHCRKIKIYHRDRGMRDCTSLKGQITAFYRVLLWGYY